MFEKHLKPRKKIFLAQLIDAAGLESVFVTEIVKRSAWEVCSAWSWRGRSRINVLQLQSTFQAIKKAARSGGGRVVLLLDSHVAARVIAKRRSSAKALQPLLRKICALGLAFGISISVHFLPTRLNVADDPTRDAVLRDASDGEPWFEKLEQHPSSVQLLSPGLNLNDGLAIGFLSSLDFPPNMALDLALSLFRVSGHKPSDPLQISISIF